MKYLLIEIPHKAIAPNIALLKWARWCEINGHDYQYIRGGVKPDIVPDRMLMSCSFTFDSEMTEMVIDKYSGMFPGVPITIGGVFPTLYPKWFEKEKWSGDAFYGGTKVTIHQGICDEIENLAPLYGIDIKGAPYPINKIVLYASRGCVNKCGYCAVPRLEGEMRSFKTIKYMLPDNRDDFNGVVLYDNNFTEHEYFNDICDELIEYDLPVDIHGLHVESFTEDHAKKFSQMKFHAQSDLGSNYLRFSFDKLKYRDSLDKAHGYVTKYNLKPNTFAYLLFGYIDTPEDFWNRINETKKIVDKHNKPIFLYPQRYEPLTPGKRRKYISPKWTQHQITMIEKIKSKTRGFMPIYPGEKFYRYYDIGDTLSKFLRRINP